MRDSWLEYAQAAKQTALDELYQEKHMIIADPCTTMEAKTKKLRQATFKYEYKEKHSGPRS